jgi:hypothetical protein
MKSHIPDLDNYIVAAICSGTHPLVVLSSVDIESIKEPSLKIMARTLLHTNRSIIEHAAFMHSVNQIKNDGDAA